MDTCPICNRELLTGNTIDNHHLFPKTRGNRSKIIYDKINIITLHKICHMKIHHTFSEKELYDYYHTVERINSHPEMKKFVKWVQKKEPRFTDTHKDTKDRKNKRR